MMPGVINYINELGNWGYIKGYDEEIYYFSFDSLDFLKDELYIDMEVIFDFYLNGEIPYAIDIKKN